MSDWVASLVGARVPPAKGTAGSSWTNVRVGDYDIG